jgi:hypothetical protein
MENWPDLAALDTVESRLRSKISELLTLFPENPVDVTGFPMETFEAAAALDPQKIIDEGERIRSAGFAMSSSSGPAASDFDGLLGKKLDRWIGAAADAFHVRISRVRAAGDLHYELLGNGILTLAAMASLAINCRNSTVELAEATIAAIDIELGNRSDRAAKAAITVSADLAKDILSLDPTKVLTGGIATMIGVVKNVSDVAFGGGGAGEILATYTRASSYISAEFANGLAMVRDEFASRMHQADDTGQRFEATLPSPVDIESPDFRYESFYFDDMSPDGGYGGRVDRERTVMMDEHHSPSSEIGKILDGGF